MRAWLSLLFALLLAGPAVAQPRAADSNRDSAAIDILMKVDRAAKAVSSVRYNAAAKPSGIAANFASPAEGAAVMQGWQGRMPERFHAHVKTTKRGSDEPVEVTGGGNGDLYFLIDHRTKKAYSDMDPGVLGSNGRAIQGFGMIEFVHEAPFDDELNADTIELLDDVEVGGEPCHQIRVVYAGNAGESVWSFSKNDFLPRRRIRKFSDPERGEGAIEQTITDLEVDPAVDAAIFDFKLPDGYQQIDDFAP